MKIRIIMGSKINNRCLKDMVNEYAKRLSSVMEIEIIDFKSTGNDVKEYEKFIKLSEGFYRVALAVEGKQLDSESFAKWFEGKQNKNIAFLIGGAKGLSEILKKKCNELFSLSKLTFAHEHALLLLSEQIYRAYTIIQGHPYHK
ncbi:23S rRNA (pseudouridine(1915)-N(3))-methyltransferase RlmH [Deferribacter autotrophicus]|uniref:Ribosomal RNA large subunit methyltransferase H n=1 Tax=Deferribacter autotrophicus TaxID=500465 RepID=A0A5A8F6P7_9BACT|nr:23S rRNA (pseudouridine(1915)-N(3))-methyltransferase RlmH [Deferribacter autotrophicus]KAA0258509.1 23S rRNA (pseudouridine(1915)-N(3))-methyltransferase RlmH [Deferribacter autotrophicus]